MENSIIDLVIRIKNGYMAQNESIVSPYSKFKLEIAKKLKALHFIKGYEVEGEVKKNIIIELSYDEGVPGMTDVKIYSKPGRRIYVTHNQLKPVMSGFGYSFVSTSKGILTNVEAKKNKIGGELLFNIW